MLLKLVKRLNQRIINIIGTIINIMIITVITSLALCFVFGIIGKFGNISIMISLGGFFFLIFLITAVVLITIGIFILICFIIDVIKRDGLKKLFKNNIKIFTISLVILMFINFIKYRNVELIKSLLFSMLITLSLFFITEASIFIKQIENDCPDESNNE